MNSEFELFIRICMAIIFFSSSISKYNTLDKHIGIIENYKVLPPSWSSVVGKLDVLVEFCLGILLLLGLFQFLSGLIAGGLLLIYTMAIVINIMRGRKEISCGCGGVLGNHNLSWKLVIRNIILVSICILVSLNKELLFSIDAIIFRNKSLEVFGYKAWETIFVTLQAIIIVLIAKEIINIRKLFKRIILSFKDL
ncbi:MauE/DoxX family redox-associated membrane protein [Lysinibacillus sp. NPDC093190]|uniref:MauE/DoxX family redox-associated membrane protein n=1 Tax=Lysinibacillus sp. NPDC093190 TaxID=3390575 RepID=UPI003CFEF832